MLKWLYFLIYYVKFNFYIIYFKLFPKPKEYKLTDKYHDFFLMKKKKLIRSLENPKKMNENISDLFYNIDNLNKYVTDNNDFENIWKTRILLTHNPNGNVYIYYDVYKMAFIYYSDVIMNNDLLNSAAIEYVLKYLCLDLYVNEEDINNYNNKHLNALIKYHFDINDKKKDNDIFKKNDVFIKKKNAHDNKNNDNNNDNDKNKKKFYYNNKFIYAGKINSVNILNRKILYPTNFKSKYLDGLTTTNNRISYSEFKKIHIHKK